VYPIQALASAYPDLGSPRNQGPTGTGSEGCASPVTTEEGFFKGSKRLSSVLGGLRRKSTAVSMLSEKHKKVNGYGGGGAVGETKLTKATFGFTGQKAMEHLDEDEYSVTDFYFTEGYCQMIATNEHFQNATLALIVINAMYLGVDADHNNADNLYQAHPAFIVCENFFCIFFLFEWSVRFGSFKFKPNCLKDMWFKFDSGLMLLMILETWVLPVVLSGMKALPTGPLRLLRLLRLARMGRIIRALPELVTMIKGAAAANRAVLASFIAIVGMIYIFAILFNVLLKGEPRTDAQFHTIPLTMWTLLMDGMYQDNYRIVTENIMYGPPPFVAAIALTFFLIFTMISALTVLNMLIGVQCEVVSNVAAQEKDEIEVNLLKTTVLQMLKELDADDSGEIDKDELLGLMENEEALAVLSTLQIDVTHLLSYLMMVYEQMEAVSIADLMHAMLKMRGDRDVTVADLIHAQTYGVWVLTGRMPQDVSAQNQIALQQSSDFSSGKGSICSSTPMQRRGSVMEVSPNLVQAVRKSVRHSEFGHRKTGQVVLAPAAKADGTAGPSKAMFGKIGGQADCLDEEPYNVTKFYHKTGFCQLIATNDHFGNGTLAVICINAMYLGVDADHNNAASLYDAEWIFILCENLFCFFFLFEWIVRFGSFEDKRNCRKDTWFKFDSFLVALMVIETWFLPVVLAGVDLPLGPLRLLRLLRLARMGRIIRALPELVTMIKGAYAAHRAVLAAFAAIIMLVYVFAILLNLLLKPYDALKPQFGTLPRTMWTLLQDGMYQDSYRATLEGIMYVPPPFTAAIAVASFCVSRLYLL
jgi:hypothetical protein